ALQMAEVRLRLEDHYGVRDFDAQFAIPVPIDQAQDSGVLALYQRVANATQRLLTAEQRLTVSTADLVAAAAEAFAQAPATEDFSGRLFILPEAVAQIASYMTSLEATGGVHGVIDIGAGTTDVSVFMLEKPRNQVTTCYWYGALAIPKASAFVQDAVAAATPNSERMTESDLLRECANQGQVVTAALRQIKKLSNVAWNEGIGHLKEQHR